jgi:outer membrane protein assembly factor BamB
LPWTGKKFTLGGQQPGVSQAHRPQPVGEIPEAPHGAQPVGLLSLVVRKPFLLEFCMSDTTSPVPFAPQPSEESAPAAVELTRPAVSAVPRPRLWPAVAVVVLQWLLLLVPGWIWPGTFAQFYCWFGGVIVGAVGLVLWWLFASRLRWADRGLGLLVLIAGLAAAWVFCDPTVRDSGVLMFFALPAVTTAWVLWLVATPFLRWPARRVSMLVVLLLVCGFWLLFRNEGVWGNISPTLRYRWSQTPEEKHLAEVKSGKLGSAPLETSAAAPLVFQPGDWPGFRGVDRSSRLTGVRIATDWNDHPPRQIWRHRIGPGWSSFAVVGNRLYTQEQRGDDELVVCYNAETGKEVWAHRDAERFSEAMAGPGPRATPTFHDGKIYAQGARGRLNCLDAATGRVLWSRDIKEDSGAKDPPIWGFAASPLVVGGIVTVFAGGPDGKSVLGYDTASGELAWAKGEGQLSYCSLQPARLGGVEQLLINTDRGLTAFDPARGEVLWEARWQLKDMARIVQPAVVSDSEVLIGTGFGTGTRRVEVRHEGDNWATQEKWTTRAINPYFNDLVIHRGHLYGFDNNFLTCVSLEDGKGKWRARGYGNGQVLLLADQDLLLVLAETGEAALVEASPGGHKELGRFQALEGKTWNHPVVAHGKLFVRNGEEVACYQLTEAGK